MVKCLNQVNKRRDAMMKRLEHDTILAALKWKHRQLKLYQQRTSMPTPDDVNLAKLHCELQSKDAVIWHFQKESLVLEETIEKLQ